MDIVPIERRPTDTSILSTLSAKKIDVKYVEVVKKTPVSLHCFDRVSKKVYAEFSTLPKLDPYGKVVTCAWKESSGIYVSGNNWYSIETKGTGVNVASNTKFNKGDGYWNPIIYLGKTEQKSKPVTVLATDPLNPNYSYNTIEWDYGICKRRLRLIEGLFQEFYVFTSNPGNDVTIQSNYKGTLKNVAPWGIDGNDEPIEVVIKDKAKVLSKDFLAKIKYPLTIDDSQAFTSNSYDGFVYYNNAAYNSAHGSSTGSVYAGEQYFVVGQYYYSGGYQYYIYRAAVFFDTSGLNDSATITGATLSLYGDTDYSYTDFVITVVPSTNIASTGLVAGDYGDLKNNTTNYGTFDTSGFSTSGYNDITLNSDGYGTISKTGTTIFGIRSAEDINKSQPTGYERVSIKSSEVGSGYEPKLTVTYTGVGETFTPISGIGMDTYHLY